MFPSRPVIMVLAVAVVAAVAGAVFYQPLPRPDEADRDQLIHWLVLRDLNEETPKLRLALVRRLETEFGGDAEESVDWDAAEKQLSSAHKKRMRENLMLLLEPWFMDKMDGYFATAANQRAAYVDRILATVTAWQGIEQISSEGAEEGDGLMGLLKDRIECWKEKAAPERKAQIAEFVLAISLRSFFTGYSAG